MDAQWLRSQFKAQPDKSKAGLAEAIGVDPPAISKILAGTRQIKAREYAAMRRYFGLPVDGIKAASNQQSGYVIEPLDKATGGLRDEQKPADNAAGWMIPADILSQRTKASPDKIRIHRVEETLMEPEFRRNEHVVVDLSDTSPSPPGIFIVSDGFGLLVRHCAYVPGSKPAQIKLSTTDRGTPPLIVSKNELEIIGRVIAKMQWV